MELIKIIDNKPILDSEIASQLAEYERKVKLIEEEEKRLKNAILKAMEEHNIIKIDTEEILINYIPDGDREKFESKKFKEEHPDLYDEYISLIPVKSSIRIRLKK